MTDSKRNRKKKLFCISFSFYQVYAVHPNQIDQLEFQGLRNFQGIRDQDLPQFWDQSGNNIPRYDPELLCCKTTRLWKKMS